MKIAKILLLIFALSGGDCGLSWAAGGTYRFMAGTIAAAAKSKQKHRLAVIGFSTEAGRSSRACSIITARLTSELASKPNLEIIERGQLDGLLHQRKLGSNGTVDSATLKKIGTALGADAVVTGTVIELDDRKLEVYTRLLDTKDGRILKALTTTIKKDWKEEKRGGLNEFDFDEAMDLESASDLLPDDFNETAVCDKPSDEDAALVRTCVDLRARKTAHGMKTGAIKIRELTKNPGADIKDAGLKNLFYSKMKEWYDSDQLKALTTEEEALLEKGAPMVEKYPCAI
jgi:TolB-like protein